MGGGESWNFRSVAVVGSGAIGLYYGGKLAAAGEDVRFLARSDYEVMRERGLEAVSIHGDFAVPDAAVFRSAEEIGPVDLVVVSWKATSNDALGGILPPLLHEGTQVLTLQNGLGNCEKLAEVVGPERVLGGLCFVCINRTGAGQVTHSGGGRISLGEWERAAGRRAEVLAQRFQAAGIQGFAVDDLRKAQWEKLIWNIPFNGLSVAEGGVTTDVLLADAEMERETRKIMEEVLAAAAVLGHELEPGLIDSNIERTRPMGGYRTSSMIDFVEGREVEVAPIWEEPLRRAVAAGAKMPRTEEMLGRIRQRLVARG